MRRRPRGEEDDPYVERPYLSTGALYSVNDWDPEHRPQRPSFGFSKPQITVPKMYRPQGKRPR